MASNFPSSARGVLAALVKTGVYRLVGSGQALPSGGGDYGEIEGVELGRFDTEADDAQKTSYLGTVVFSDLLLRENDSDAGLSIDTVLIDVTQSRNIVTTAVQGRNGTVKEYISDGDYQINVRGVLVEPFSNSYPSEQVSTLIRLCQVPAALECISSFLQQFGIYSLVVEEYRVAQLEGFQNMQPFELRCLSDVPIELIQEEDTI